MMDVAGWRITSIDRKDGFWEYVLQIGDCEFSAITCKDYSGDGMEKIMEKADLAIDRLNIGSRKKAKVNRHTIDG